jgi:hypothetical protein|tara:strand:- start:206 stop:469 length:264 start_codon:yes stop_codon:yes gene_type:complete
MDKESWTEGFNVGYDRGFFAGQVKGGVTDPRKIKKGGAVKRKLSDWQKFIKANSSKKKFKFANGKLKLKTMGIAYRKTAAYKRNKKK